MTVTAVLDVGKTNVKLVLFEGASTLWQRSTPNRRRDGPPYPHEDVAAIEAFALRALTDAGREHRIDAIVVTTHGAALALLGDDGLALPVMDYEFDGVDEIGADYAREKPAFAETFTPLMPAGLIVGRQLWWQEKRLPEAFRRVRAILPYPQYFAYLLSGVAASEVTSLGCHADLWRPVEGRPSSLAIAHGWDRLIPPVRRAFDTLGPITPRIAAATGLAPTTPVLAGIHDSNASLLPHLLSLAPPFTVVSTGTWVVTLAVGASTTRLDPALDMLANVDATGTPVPTAKFMGGREIAAILDGGDPDCELDDLAAVLAWDALALPAFSPNGGPFVGRQGRIIGDLPPGPRPRAALAALYAALVTDYQIDAMGADRGPIVIEGSFAANPVFAAALATLRAGQVVVASPDTAGTAYGASLLATWPKAPVRAAAREVPPLADAGPLLTHRRRWLDAIGARSLP